MDNPHRHLGAVRPPAPLWSTASSSTPLSCATSWPPSERPKLALKPTLFQRGRA